MLSINLDKLKSTDTTGGKWLSLPPDLQARVSVSFISEILGSKIRRSSIFRAPPGKGEKIKGFLYTAGVDGHKESRDAKNPSKVQSVLRLGEKRLKNEE